MANTFTQIYIHIVFAVSGHQHFIKTEFKEELQRYITGIIRKREQTLIAINIMPDHAHILIGLKPDIALSDLVRDIKAVSSKFINDRKWTIGKFHWQEGYGAFSYSHSQLDKVRDYINNQEKHHFQKSFRDEYLKILQKFNVPYDMKYVFD